MKFTNLQKKVLNFKKAGNIVFRKMYSNNHELGYTSKNKEGSFDINIASDAPNEEIKQIVLLHELGHVYFGHVTKDLSKEISTIKDLLKINNKTIKSFCMKYKGFMTFINICMDLEVNSKLLTISNIKTINKYFKICLPSTFNTTIHNSYEEYYEPLIQIIKEEDENFSCNKDEDEEYKNIPNDLPVKIPYSKIDKDLKDILKKEEYKSGNEKSKKRNVIGESTVEIYVDMYSENKSENFTLEDAETIPLDTYRENISSEKKIENFLKKIISSEPFYAHDCLKHYNRGTRKNDLNILYNSYRYKHSFQPKKKLGIVIDVSGSMEPDDILKAIRTLKEYSNVLSEESTLITWNTTLVDSYPLHKTPEYVNIGGNTELSTSIEYLANKRFTDVIIYSDFETPLEKMLYMKKKYSSKLNLYSISIGNNERFKSYFKGMPLLII